MTRPHAAGPMRDAAAGVTLIEVLVALILFALIGAAGFSVLDQVIRVQSRTEGRLDRLAQMQRTMHIVSQDFMQTAGGSLSYADGAVSFRRSAAAGELAVRYSLEDATLIRSLSGGRDGPPARQALLSGVREIRWAFRDHEDGWIESWPPDRTETAPANPVAVTLDLVLGGPGLAGDLRRVAVLPAEVRQ